jgi:hypothetical protein
MRHNLNADEDNRYLPARAVAQRYGVTFMTLFRWLANEDMGFPVPIYIGRYRLLAV